LERPFQEVFESGKPNFPFMLCWANENWTRVWDGGEKNILLQQHYSEEDDRNHIRSLLPYFKDERYIKVDGKPVFAVYRTNQLPSPKRTTEIWREEAQKEGLELYLCRFENFGNIGEQYLINEGFDAAIDFQPFGNYITDFRNQKIHKFANPPIAQRIKNKIDRTALRLFDVEQYELQQEMQHKVWDYEEYVNYVIQQPFPNYKWFPGITPSWDNYARKKKNFLIFKNASPQAYRKWLEHIVLNYKPVSAQENFVFINAWNEWAEGNHLEPCIKWGKQYLESTKEVLKLLK
jgi:lipopolysaccharide biosynthesis protein